MNEVLLAGFGSNNDPIGYGVSVDYEDRVITFTAGSSIKQVLTDPLMTENNKSIGQRNIDWLHEKLDEWINKQLEENT